MQVVCLGLELACLIIKCIGQDIRVGRRCPSMVELQAALVGTPASQSHCWPSLLQLETDESLLPPFS